MVSLNEIKKICPSSFANFPLKSLTTFKIGGNADFVVFPQNLDELKSILEYIRANNVNFFVLGGGSNVLADDLGYRGIIICTKKLNQIQKLSRCKIKVQSGVMLSSVVRYCTQNSLHGLEWATGIPATIGGAVFMNAGAYGGEIADVVESVTFIQDNEIVSLDKSKLFFDYRKSLFTNTKNCVIIEIVLKLKKGNIEQITKTVREFTLKRATAQNVGYASAGSVFKRTKSNPPAYLIEQCGLKGARIGDAVVSPVHAGFIVNIGKATANQVRALIQKIQSRVFSKFNVNLECEIIDLRSNDDKNENDS